MSPDISIIICTFNRCESLKGILQSLLKQEDGGVFSWEILVVDNNSTDETKTVVEQHQPVFGNRLRYVFEANQGISFARNRGIQEAAGEMVAFTDDDCIADPHWLRNFLVAMRSHRCAAMGGRILSIFPSRTPRWVKDHYDLLRGPIVYHDYGEDIKPYQKPMLVMMGASMVFRKDVFKRFGLFRTDLGVGQGTMGEETEFFNRLKKSGQEIFYCGKALVWHPVEVERMNLKYIAHWNMCLGKYRFLVDECGYTDPELVHYFGIPRYLIREALGLGLSLVTVLFNQREFLRRWVILARTIGRIQAILKCRQDAAVSLKGA